MPPLLSNLEAIPAADKRAVSNARTIATPPALRLTVAKLHQIVRFALAAENRRQREVVSLHHYAGLSIDQAAAIMGVSGGEARSLATTVKRRAEEAAKIFHNEQILTRLLATSVKKKTKGRH